MIDVRRETAIVRTFMTHDLSDTNVIALSTGRDQELRRIMEDIKRSRKASPGTMQHAVIYGTRGLGKSFMLRRVEIELNRSKDETLKSVLLPEEQHNLYDRPHALLEMIARRLGDIVSGDDSSFDEGHYKWPTHDDEPQLWRKQEIAVEEAIDRALPDGNGLVVVMIENFDILLSTLFRKSEDEQRLRAWLDRSNNRLMLLATATGAVDLDYDRPLFQAFDSVHLQPWTGEECITYFNKLRQLEGRPVLTEEQEAKALALADFVGGIPRIAQLLSEAIETDDAIFVVDTLTAVADDLAEYYRSRIENLAPRARGLLDALIRGGEPASQTELAERVGAKSQSSIAQVMAELQRSGILIGRREPSGRATLYRVADRIFVHYYRLRQGQRMVKQTPLATILDFLKGFYTHRERQELALAHLDAGHIVEAGLFNSLTTREYKIGQNEFIKNFPLWLETWRDAVPNRSSIVLEGIDDLFSVTSEDLYTQCHASERELSSHSICTILCAWACLRMGQTQRGFELLKIALQRSQESPIEDRIFAQLIMTRYLSLVADDNFEAAQLGSQLKEGTEAISSPELDSERLITAGWSEAVIGRFDEALLLNNKALDRAKFAKNDRLVASTLRNMAWIYIDLEQYESALDAANQAHLLASNTADSSETAPALIAKATAQILLGRISEAYQTSQFTLKILEGNEYAAAQAQAMFNLINCALELDVDLTSTIANYESFLDAERFGAIMHEGVALLLSKIMIKMAISGETSKFDDSMDCLARKFGLQNGPIHFYADNGIALAQYARSSGRAAAATAFAWLLPKIALVLEQLPKNQHDQTWLSNLLAGFASESRDPGLMRDIASLITPDLNLFSADVADLLNDIADVDETDNPETIIARMNPDKAMLIRRLRDLPDPEKTEALQRRR